MDAKAQYWENKTKLALEDLRPSMIRMKLNQKMANESQQDKEMHFMIMQKILSQGLLNRQQSKTRLGFFK